MIKSSHGKMYATLFGFLALNWLSFGENKSYISELNERTNE